MVKCHIVCNLTITVTKSLSIDVVSGCSDVVVEYRTRNQEVAGLTCATLSKLLTHCVLRPTQPPTLSGTRNE